MWKLRTTNLPARAGPATNHVGTNRVGLAMNGVGVNELLPFTGPISRSRDCAKCDAWFTSSIELHRVRNIGRLISLLAKVYSVSKNVYVHVTPLHLYPGEPPTIVQTSGSLES